MVCVEYSSLTNTLAYVIRLSKILCSFLKHRKVLKNYNLTMLEASFLVKKWRYVTSHIIDEKYNRQKICCLAHWKFLLQFLLLRLTITSGMADGDFRYLKLLECGPQHSWDMSHLFPNSVSKIKTDLAYFLLDLSSENFQKPRENKQGILKGEVLLYCWPPVWLVWISLFTK
jgi:hypothetical protein